MHNCNSNTPSFAVSYFKNLLLGRWLDYRNATDRCQESSPFPKRRIPHFTSVQLARLQPPGSFPSILNLGAPLAARSGRDLLGAGGRTGAAPPPAAGTLVWGLLEPPPAPEPPIPGDPPAGVGLRDPGFRPLGTLSRMSPRGELRGPPRTYLPCGRRTRRSSCSA